MTFGSLPDELPHLCLGFRRRNTTRQVSGTKVFLQSSVVQRSRLHGERRPDRSSARNPGSRQSSQEVCPRNSPKLVRLTREAGYLSRASRPLERPGSGAALLGSGSERLDSDPTGADLRSAPVTSGGLTPASCSDRAASGSRATASIPGTSGPALLDLIGMDERPGRSSRGGRRSGGGSGRASSGTWRWRRGIGARRRRCRRWCGRSVPCSWIRCPAAAQATCGRSINHRRCGIVEGARPLFHHE